MNNMNFSKLRIIPNFINAKWKAEKFHLETQQSSVAMGTSDASVTDGHPYCRIVNELINIIHAHLNESPDSSCSA